MVKWSWLAQLVEQVINIARVRYLIPTGTTHAKKKYALTVLDKSFNQMAYIIC